MAAQEKIDSLEDVIQTPIKNFEHITNILITKGSEIGWSLVSAILTLIVGFWLSTKIKNFVENRMIARGIDPSIRTFLIPIINIVLKVMIIMFVVDRLGLNASGLIAAIGGIGLAVGLALQGSLSNFAAGILILIFKPFKVGDTILSQGHEGVVESISILNTVLSTGKGQIITLPNGNLFNNPIINSSTKQIRRVDINLGLSYSEDFDRVRDILLDILTKNELVLQAEPKTVEIAEFGPSTLNVAIRCFVNNGDYGNAMPALLRSVKYRLEANNISMASPKTELIVTNSEQNVLPTNSTK